MHLLSCLYRFQSTLPMRGETISTVYCACFCGISIHSPHAGRDFGSCFSCPEKLYFNPLSPCGERRYFPVSMYRLYHFNPLSPCGERLLKPVKKVEYIQFQSTLPMRGETAKINNLHILDFCIYWLIYL